MHLLPLRVPDLQHFTECSSHRFKLLLTASVLGAVVRYSQNFSFTEPPENNLFFPPGQQPGIQHWQTSHLEQVVHSRQKTWNKTKHFFLYKHRGDTFLFPVEVKWICSTILTTTAVNLMCYHQNAENRLILNVWSFIDFLIDSHCVWVGKGGLTRFLKVWQILMSQEYLWFMFHNMLK